MTLTISIFLPRAIFLIISILSVLVLRESLAWEGLEEMKK